MALEHVLDVARRVAEGRGSLEWLQDALDNLDAKTEDTVPNGQMRLCWYVDLYGDRVYGWKSVLNNDGRCVACDQLLPAESTMTREPLPKRTSAAPLADGADRVQGATEPPRKRTSADPSGDGRLQSNFRDSDEFTRGYRQAVEDHG